MRVCMRARACAYMCVHVFSAENANPPFLVSQVCIPIHFKLLIHAKEDASEICMFGLVAGGTRVWGVVR